MIPAESASELAVNSLEKCYLGREWPGKPRFYVANHTKNDLRMFFNIKRVKWKDFKKDSPESDGELGHPKLEDGTTRTVGSFLCPSLSPKKALVVHFRPNIFQ